MAQERLNTIWVWDPSLDTMAEARTLPELQTRTNPRGATAWMLTTLMR